MKKILSSILITNYNKSKYIKNSIKSCLDQSFKKKEILIFDDCSDDNSVQIIKKYKKVKLFRNLKKKIQ